MKRRTTRRAFLKETSLLAAAAAAVRAAEARAAPAALPASGTLPTIRLGGCEVSRLILGSNPFFGFAHGNPQASAEEMKAFYTPERIMAVMDAAAGHGITAVWTPSYDHWIRLWNTYRKGGGKLATWIGQPDHFDAMKDHITACAKNGAAAVCIQGECVGRAMREGKVDLVRSWLEHIKSYGLPAGLASHWPGDLLKAEEHGLPAEWYHLTVGVPDAFKPDDCEKALAVMHGMQKPVVAFKVLGAGRVMPKDAFPRVLGRLHRKDGLCVGVFPKARDEVRENAGLARQLMA
jgi:hypothetical protein